MDNPFRGLGIALVTPFTVAGEVDYDCLEHHVEQCISDGADFLCVLGTTAETPTLTQEEKAKIMRTVAAVNKGRVPLLVGIGGNCTRQVCEDVKGYDLTGYAGILVVAPYYNKPSQEGVYQHFKMVASATELPVVLYNIPGRTGINIEAETTIRLAAECPNVVAIKEASGRIEQIERLVASTPDGFEVLSGDDSLTLELLKKGCVGVISVIANAFTKQFLPVVRERSETADAKLRKVMQLSMAEGNPAGIKGIMSACGRCNNVLRLPLVPVSRELQEEICNNVKTLNE